MTDDVKRFATPEAVAQHLTEAAASGDAGIILLALREIVVERGAGRIAQMTGISRGHLYKTTDGTHTPRLDTVMKILGALGVRLVATPIP